MESQPENTPEETETVEEEQEETDEEPTEQPEVKSGDTCADCQGTGLFLPEGDKKFISQATRACDTCKGSGTIE